MDIPSPLSYILLLPTPLLNITIIPCHPIASYAIFLARVFFVFLAMTSEVIARHDVLRSKHLSLTELWGKSSNKWPLVRILWYFNIFYIPDISDLLPCCIAISFCKMMRQFASGFHWWWSCSSSGNGAAASLCKPSALNESPEPWSSFIDHLCRL